MGDELLFYVSSRTLDRQMSTGAGVLRRYGFASLDTGVQEYMLTTRPVQFDGKHLFVNVDADGGLQWWPPGAGYSSGKAESLEPGSEWQCQSDMAQRLCRGRIAESFEKFGLRENAFDEP